jgi:Flp pilus assembly pilin Flp
MDMNKIRLKMVKGFINKQVYLNNKIRAAIEDESGMGMVEIALIIIIIITLGITFKKEINDLVSDIFGSLDFSKLN